MTMCIQAGLVIHHWDQNLHIFSVHFHYRFFPNLGIFLVGIPDPGILNFDRDCPHNTEYLTGYISAEIKFGGDNFRHHFCQISALISADMFSNILNFLLVAMNVPSYFYPALLLFYSCMYDFNFTRELYWAVSTTLSTESFVG